MSPHANATYVDMSRGRTLATATEDGEVRLGESCTRAPAGRTLRGPGDVRRVGIDPSGRFLAGGPLGEQDPSPFVLWDLRSVPDAAPVSLKKEQGRIMGADFSPDGAWMGSVHWAYAVLWRLHDQLPRRLQRRRGSASEVAFSPDGRSLIASGMTGVLETFPIHVDRPLYVSCATWLEGGTAAFKWIPLVASWRWSSPGLAKEQGPHRAPGCGDRTGDADARRTHH